MTDLNNGLLCLSLSLRDLMDGTVTAKLLSSRKRREKEDRIGESCLPSRRSTLQAKLFFCGGLPTNFRPFEDLAFGVNGTLLDELENGPG
jgi:hypothetical protein